MDIKLIDPTKDFNIVIQDLHETEILMAEAMHRAIVADSYRIPWIPIKYNKTINDFKWTDFCQSLGIKFNPNHVKTLYDKSFLEGILKNKIASLNSNLINIFFSNGYYAYQNTIFEKEVINKFQKYKNAE